MTKLKYVTEQILNDPIIPKEVAEVQVNYINKFGVNKYDDLYTIEVYRQGFQGRANKEFKENYINLINSAIENEKRLTDEDWRRFFNIPVEYTQEGIIEYADT